MIQCLNFLYRRAQRASWYRLVRLHSNHIYDFRSENGPKSHKTQCKPYLFIYQGGLYQNRTVNFKQLQAINSHSFFFFNYLLHRKINLKIPFHQIFYFRQNLQTLIFEFTKQRCKNQNRSSNDFLQNYQMINLQGSKKLIKNYQQLVPHSLTRNSHSRTLPAHQKIVQLTFQSPKPHIVELSKQLPSRDFGKTISKMIQIQFQEINKTRQNQQIRLKRKMLTSTQKFHSRKKNNYSTCVKQSFHKTPVNNTNSTHLAIGSHAIRKIDYATFIFPKNFKMIEDSFSLKKRLKNQMIHFSQFKPITAKQQSTKVLILRKTQKNNLEDILYNPNMSKTQRKLNHSKQNIPLDTVYSSQKQQNLKNIAIQQFIPLRKNSARKQPFVFGLGQKQLNPQKNREKLLAYHDFLWKINYSNGLYIKPTEQETTYKAFIGPGNNSNLIRSIIKRRFWWTVTDKQENCNFVWTQLKINSIFKEQKNSDTKISTLYSKNLEVEDNLKTEPIARLQQGHQRIFNINDLINWNRHMRKYRRSESALSNKTYKNRAQFLNCKELIRIDTSTKISMHNHLQQNYYIGNKKSLFYHMKKYYQLQQKDVFEALPLTFHINKGIDDPQFKNFQTVFNDLQQHKRKTPDFKNVWIMKPGQNSNRGNGITVCYGMQQIKLRLKAKQKNSDGNLRTFIIQKYMEKPLLYKNRKFDIRHYLLLTSFNGIIKAYWFPEGYIRTSSSIFTLKRGTNLLVHLTNDAVQKHAQDYGKYEKGNKISYQKFQNYLNKTIQKDKHNYFFGKILPEMKNLAIEAVRATYLSLDANRKQHNFQLLGMDFMIDQGLKPWLIEINTNPCLELSCPLLSKIIPTLIQQTFRLCVDPFFPPPEEWSVTKKMCIGQNMLEENQFQLIFDESVDGEKVVQIFGVNRGLDLNMGKIEEDAQVYQNDGVQQWQQKQH